MANAVKPTKEQTKRHALHVNLIMVQDEVNKPVAECAAWLEGPGGVAARMAPVIVAEKKQP